MNYEQTLADQAVKNDKAQRDEVNARGWHAILNRYPLRDTQANYSMLLQWANPLTLEAFEELLRTKPAGFTLDAVSREQIIDDIVKHSHLQDGNERRQLTFRLGTYSLAQLRQKRRDQEFKQTVRTKEDAKKYVASQRDTEIGWRGTGYPKLQSTIVPPGQVQAIPTGQYLRDLAKHDFWQFKRMVKLYSSEQVNYWLAQ